MAIASQNVSPQTLTYEQYMAEGEVFLRYDIIDGVRIVTNPTERHQDILFNIATALKRFAKESGRGKMVLAPCDVLIHKTPLRARQPDVLFISRERHALNRPSTDPAPLSPAAELVVEILSPSDTRTVLDNKLADYRSVDVLECWVVSPSVRTVEVLRLMSTGVESVATYTEGEIARSITFTDLAVPVSEIFAE